MLAQRWWLLCGVVLVGVVTLNGVVNGVVDAKAAPKPRAVCVRVGAKATDGVSGRGLVCVQTKVRGLRWRFAPTAVTTTTTSVAPSTTVAVVPTVSLAATFIDSGKFPKAAVVTANVAGTVYFIEGASPVSTVSDITFARYYRWTSGVVTANTPTSIALDVNVLTNGYYRVFVANSQGVLSAPAFNKVTISIPRISNVAVTTTTVALTCATGGVCAVGDTGPGGGIVFYVSATNFTSTGSDCNTACKYLEAAPNNWGASTNVEDLCRGVVADRDPECLWSGNQAGEIGATARGFVVGSGYANTQAAVGQAGGGNTAGHAITAAWDYTNNTKSDWHLPSRDELNELCKYARNTGQAAGAAIICDGGTLRTGFSNMTYWSSTENNGGSAWVHPFGGLVTQDGKSWVGHVFRPVRAFG